MLRCSKCSIPSTSGAQIPCVMILYYLLLVAISTQGQLLRNDIRRDAVWLTGSSSSSGGSRLSGNSEFGNKVGKEERRRQARQVPPMEPHIVRDEEMFLLDTKFPLVFDDDDAIISLAERNGPAGEAGVPLTPTEPHVTREDDDAPAFSGALETNVTASLGQTAFLRCRLKNAQHQVTWIRLRDWHILTSGMLTYTADARFRVKHASEASEWTLEIKFLQKRDEGTYYCQIPTKTGTMVHAFYLHVASPQAVILGGQVSHVDILTPSLTLVCIVDNTPDPPQVIFWYHNGTLLTDGKYPPTSADGVSSGVISSHLTLTATRTMSMLTLQNIQHIHSGNYTCRAPNAESDTTQLFVTQRHEQAAVHRSRSSGRSHQAPDGWAPILLLAVVAARMAGDDPATALIASLIGHVGAVRRKFPR